jgi:hypothetical protein
VTATVDAKVEDIFTEETEGEEERRPPSGVDRRYGSHRSRANASAHRGLVAPQRRSRAPSTAVE